MTELFDSFHVKEESDKYRVTSIRPVQPRGWRDAWAVLRGKYVAKLCRHRAITAAGADKVMKEHYTPGLRDQLTEHGSLFMDNTFEEPHD